MSNALTMLEHRLVEKLGSLMEDFVEISGPKRENDMFEVMLHVHALQNMVLAQAAARAYPGTYRELGESLRFDGIPNGPSVEPVLNDWEPLGENVRGHAMFQAVDDHEDGRQCAWHMRLRAFAFEGDKKCLRRDHTVAEGIRAPWV